MKTLKYYIAFKRIKNFVCLEVHPQNGKIVLFLKMDPVITAKKFYHPCHLFYHFARRNLPCYAISIINRSMATVLKQKSLILLLFTEKSGIGFPQSCKL